MDNGRGDTVQLRVALWEGKGMGEALGTCRDLLALVAEELKEQRVRRLGGRGSCKAAVGQTGREQVYSSLRRWVLDAVERN